MSRVVDTAVGNHITAASFSWCVLLRSLHRCVGTAFVVDEVEHVYNQDVDLRGPFLTLRLSIVSESTRGLDL